MEQFKIIQTHPDYQVSSLGYVVSTRRGKVLKPDLIKGVYKRVSLSKDGKVLRVFVHRLVAEAFIPNPLNKPYVNHIDNDPTNNTVGNLEWVTHSENMLHCTSQGRGSYKQAAKQCVENKREAITETVKKSLGEYFVSYNAVPGGKASITFKCSVCGDERTSRTDSPVFNADRIMCRKCTYASTKGNNV